MRKRSGKHYPTVRTANLANVSGVPQNDRVLLVDQALSKLNRRLYRQGRNYEVKVDIDVTLGTDIVVYALRDDWAVQKAYQMAYRQYLENTAEERKRLGSQVARWEDFRVQHGTLGTDLAHPLLYDANGVGVALTSGEFNDANVVDSSGTRRAFTWGAASASLYSILAEYDKAGNAQATPSSVPADGPYEGINTEVNAETMDDLQGDNNQPPYDQTGLAANTPWVKVAELGLQSSAQKLSTGYFTAPCGIIVIRGVGAASNDAKVSFTVKAGDYKGVHASSMTDGVMSKFKHDSLGN
jgi:hypothetical protein